MGAVRKQVGLEFAYIWSIICLHAYYCRWVARCKAVGLSRSHHVNTI